MINAIQWFKDKGFLFDDRITIYDVIALQNDAMRDGLNGAAEMILNVPSYISDNELASMIRGAALDIKDPCIKCGKMFSGSFTGECQECESRIIREICERHDQSKN